MSVKGLFSDLARPGAEFACRVTPRARRADVTRTADGFAIAVSAPPDEGRANAAVARALAEALGVAKTRLTLIRGQTARDKVFRLD